MKIYSQKKGSPIDEITLHTSTVDSMSLLKKRVVEEMDDYNFYISKPDHVADMRIYKDVILTVIGKFEFDNEYSSLDAVYRVVLDLKNEVQYLHQQLGKLSQ